MKQEPDLNTPTISAADIVALVKVHLEVFGFEETRKHFESMERIMSAASWWGPVKSQVYMFFAEERRRLQEAAEKAELARAKAGATNVIQVLPKAQTGIGDGNTDFTIDQLNQVMGSSPKIIHHYIKEGEDS